MVKRKLIQTSTVRTKVRTDVFFKITNYKTRGRVYLKYRTRLNKNEKRSSIAKINLQK